MDARITSVEERTIGSALTADTSIGAGTITVSDATDFDLTGELQLGAEIMTYSNVDEETGIITLVGTLAATHTADDPVYVYPLSQDRTAYLVAGDDPGDEEGMAARVPHALWDKIPVGIRSWPDGEGESVQADFISDELVIMELTGQDPVIDGSFVDLSGVTVPTTDGLPPSSSPAIDTALGTLRYVFLKWTAISNADQLTYEVHVSTSSGFTPSILTRAQEISGTFAAVNTLADGTPLAYATDYYFKLIAKDADGSAAAGAQSGPVQLNPAAPDDLAVGSVTAAKLESFLVLANTIATATSGARIEIDSNGITLYDSTGAASMVLDAQTGSIIIRGQFDFGSDPSNPSRLAQDIVDLVNQPATFETPRHVLSSTQEYSNNSGPFNPGFGWTTTKGNVLLMQVVIWKSTGTPQTISSAPAAWTQVATATQGQLRVYTYKIENAASRTTVGSFSTSAAIGVNDRMRVQLVEISGASAVDVATSAVGNSTTPSTGTTGTSTQVNGRTWGTVAWTAGSGVTFSTVVENVNGSSAGTPDLTYNMNVTALKEGAAMFEDDHTSGLNTYNYTVTLSAATDWIGTIVFLKAKAATGVPDAPASSRIRLYAALDANSKSQFYSINDNGTVSQISGGPEIIAATGVNIGSTAGTSGGSISVTLTGLKVGDYAFWVGSDISGSGTQFIYASNPPLCATANTMSLRYFNTDTATRDPASATHYFMIVRQA